MRPTWSCVICGIRSAPCGWSWRSGGALLLGWARGWRPAPEAWKRSSGHPRSDGGKKTSCLGCDSWCSWWFLYRSVVSRSLRTGLYTCCPVRRRNVKPQSDRVSYVTGQREEMHRGKNRRVSFPDEDGKPESLINEILC